MPEYFQPRSNIRKRLCQTPLRKGEVVDGHSHEFPHETFVVAGSFLIEALDADGKVLRSRTIGCPKPTDEQIKPFWILIHAGVIHRLTALEDGSIYACVFAALKRDGTVDELGEDDWMGGAE